MTQFILKDFDKWTHQNKANYTGVFFPGNLLDNFIMETKRGYAFFYESFVNCWTSEYYVTFISFKECKAHPERMDKLFCDFMIAEEKSEQETA